MDQNVIDEPEENNQNEYLASNADIANEAVLEPNTGGNSPEINQESKAFSNEAAKEQT